MCPPRSIRAMADIAVEQGTRAKAGNARLTNADHFAHNVNRVLRKQMVGYAAAVSFLFSPTHHPGSQPDDVGALFRRLFSVSMAVRCDHLK